MLGSYWTGECQPHYYPTILIETKNGGHCQPMIYHSTPEVGAFELRNYHAIKSLIATHSIPCEWTTVVGCHAFLSSSMFKEAVAGVKSLQKLDPELGKLISIVTKKSTEPSLADLRVPRAEGVILQVNAASLWPYKFISWILESLLETKHLNLQTNTPVTHLQKMEEGWIIHTSRGMLYSPSVILATNGYTSHLLPGFGDLIVPVRGEMSAILPPRSVQPAFNRNPLRHSYGFMGNTTENASHDDYLIQRPFSESDGTGGQLMFGGGRSFAANDGVGVSDDSHIDPPAAAYLRRELNLLLDLRNEDDELEATWEWSGIMGYSRDGHPWVGEVRDELEVGGGKGLWVCGGFTGHGMPNAWLCGKAAVTMMMGNEKDADVPSGYKLSRERVEQARSYDEVWMADSKV
jgi:glycine/D-amino acid oxidase-like deaminating enzyme